MHLVLSNGFTHHRYIGPMGVCLSEKILQPVRRSAVFRAGEAMNGGGVEKSFFVKR